MILQRKIEPEWLDALSPDDPGAIGSRRDLRVLNGFMMHRRTMAQLLVKHGPPKVRTILELGAGDGTFMMHVARRLAKHWPKVTVTLLDQQNLVGEETRRDFQAIGWGVRAEAADVFQYLDTPGLARVDLVTANLFLHHFTQEQLSRMFRSVARIAPLFVACEPRRNSFALLSSRMVWTLGCNSVTRHDAPASVRAGFKGRELSKLWPEQARWSLHEHAAAPFAHCYIARHDG